MNTINVIKKNHTSVVIVGASFFIIFQVARLYLSIIPHAPVNDDAGYYLSLAKRVNEGLVPYTEINFGYTPIVILLFSWFDQLIYQGKAIYSDFLALIIAFQFINAYLSFLILRNFSISYPLALCTALIQLLAVYLHEGFWIFLEAPTTTFALLAAYAMTHSKLNEKPKWILAGTCWFLSYFCKQYGLATGLGFILMALWDNKLTPRGVSLYKICWLTFITCVFFYLMSLHNSRALIIALPFFLISYALFLFKLSDLSKIIYRMQWLLVGFACTVCSIFLMIYFSWNVSPLDFIISTTPLGYAEKSQNIFELYPSSFPTFIIHYSPWLILLPLCMRNFNSNRELMILFLACSFMPPLYIRDFGHYYTLLIPFLYILGALVFKHAISYHWALPTLVFFSTLYAPWYVYRWEVEWSRKWAYKSAQMNWAKEIKPYTSNQRVLALVHPAYVYLCNLLPVQNKPTGYGFLSNYSKAQLEELLAISPMILIDLDQKHYGLDAISSVIDTEQYEMALESYGFKKHMSWVNFELWVAEEYSTRLPIQ